MLHVHRVVLWISAHTTDRRSPDRRFKGESLKLAFQQWKSVEINIQSKCPFLSECSFYSVTMIQLYSRLGESTYFQIY